MQAAPPVFVRIVPSRVWRMLQSLLGALAGASTAAWACSWWSLSAALVEPGASRMVQGAPTLIVCVLASALGALLGGALLWRASRPESVELAWDGHRWSFRPQGRQGSERQIQALPMEACDVLVAWDLGGALLLRLHTRSVSGRRRMWLMCERCGLRGAWHPLRLALFAARP